MVSTSLMVDTSSHPRAQLHRCVERSAYVGQADPAIVEEAGEVVPAPKHVVDRLQDLGGA